MFFFLTFPLNSLLHRIVQRVKVYHLNEDGKWDDRGTGHVSIDYVEVLF